jgi:hypothetical protein
MDILDPRLSFFLAAAIWFVGWLLKKTKWDLNSAQMLGIVAAMSIVLGIAQTIVALKYTPIPPCAETTWLGILFGCVGNYVVWLGTNIIIVFGFSQTIYKAIRAASGKP